MIDADAACLAVAQTRAPRKMWESWDEAATQREREGGSMAMGLGFGALEGGDKDKSRCSDTLATGGGDDVGDERELEGEQGGEGSGVHGVVFLRLRPDLGLLAISGEGGCCCCWLVCWCAFFL